MGAGCKSAWAGRFFLVREAATKFWRLPLALVVVAAFAGCAPMRSGATLDAIAPLKPGLARVYVLRDRAFGGIFDTGWQAYLDEAPMGDLKTGTFVYVDRPPGQHRLYFARPGDLFRASQQEISVLPGRTYYFRLDMNEKGQWISSSGAVAGLTGMLVSSAISAGADERGLFDFTPLNEAAAQTAMAELRLAQ
jgi:Protein of unknown function (DUF2846)